MWVDTSLFCLALVFMFCCSDAITLESRSTSCQRNRNTLYSNSFFLQVLVVSDVQAAQPSLVGNILICLENNRVEISLQSFGTLHGAKLCLVLFFVYCVVMKHTAVGIDHTVHCDGVFVSGKWGFGGAPSNYSIYKTQ